MKRSIGRRAFKWILCILGSIFLLFVFFGLWLNRKVIIEEAVSRVESQTGADLFFSSASFRYFAPTAVVINDFEIRHTDGTTWLHAKRLTLQLDVSKLLARKYEFPALFIRDAAL